MSSRFQILSKGLVRERGVMNGIEKAYANFLSSDEDVAEWWFEPMSIRLSRPDSGQPARYTPDFMVLRIDGRTYIDDVKASSGFDDNAAIVRIKCAAEQYPLWIFRTVRKLPKKRGGGWDIREV